MEQLSSIASPARQQRCAARCVADSCRRSGRVALERRRHRDRDIVCIAGLRCIGRRFQKPPLANPGAIYLGAKPLRDQPPAHPAFDLVPGERTRAPGGIAHARRRKSISLLGKPHRPISNEAFKPRCRCHFQPDARRADIGPSDLRVDARRSEIGSSHPEQRIEPSERAARSVAAGMVIFDRQPCFKRTVEGIARIGV